MLASVRALLNQIIDYAGLFPPAKLPLDVALRNYLRYKKESPHAWMLGRFVCPVGRLQELLSLAQTHPDGSYLSLTALGTQSSQASELTPQVKADLQRIDEFRRAWGNATVIDTYEAALPQAMPLEGFAVQPLAALFEESRLRGFLELPRTENWGLEIIQFSHRLEGTALGLKLRTGGVVAQAFPSVQDVAHFIYLANSCGLPWKATAGLHHPRPHWDATLQTWHHGFFNVFCSGLLVGPNSLGEKDLDSILLDRKGEHFHFADTHAAWKNWICPIAQMAVLRVRRATSFGSCSFDEPVADLIEMGLLDR